MLDENKEYEQYTSNEFDKNKISLKYETLISKDFAGMPRALFIIARGYMHNLKKINECENEKEKIKNDCKELLKAWLGFKYDEKYNEDEKFKKLKNWLPNYILNELLSPRLDKCEESNEVLKTIEEHVKNFIENKDEKDILISDIDKITQIIHEKKDNILAQILKILEAYMALKNKAGYISQGIYNSKYQDGKNKNKMLRLDDIIVDAYHSGELKSRYLIFKDSKLPFDYIYKEKEGNYKKLNVNSQKDFILKMTAIYLICKIQNQENMIDEIFNKYMHLNKQDMINWLDATKFPELKNKRNDKDVFFFSKDGQSFEPLFDEKLEGNYFKFSMNQKWLEMFEISEEKPTEKGRIFFIDHGASQVLEQKKVK